MNEFAENVWLKLSPYINADSRVVEIDIMNSVIQYLENFEEYVEAIRRLSNLIKSGIILWEIS